MKKYITQFLYLLDSQAKKKLPFLVAAFLLSSLLDVIGISLIGIFLGLLTNPYFFLQKLPSIVLLIPQKKLIVYAGLLIISAFVIKTILMLYIQFKLVSFCQAFSVRLKIRLMKAYQCAPYTYHLQKNSAYMVSKIQDNINGYVNNVLMPTLTFISSGLMTISILSFLLFLQPLSTSFLIGMFVLLGLGYDLLVKKKLLSRGKVVALSSGAIIKSIHQGLHGLNESRVIGKENFFLDRVRKASHQYAEAYGVLVTMQLTPRYLIESMMAIFVIAFTLGGLAFNVEAGSIIAIVGMFAAAGTRLLPTVSQTMTSINQVRGSFHHMHLIFHDLNELSLLTGGISKVDTHSDHNGKMNFFEMSFNDIYYKYPNSKNFALENVNFKIFKGQSIGLIGSSGAGKSTLINIILGFLEPQQGQIQVDNHPIENRRAWLNNFAYIPQTIFLLDDTLRRNVAFGTEDDQIDDVRIWSALRMAQLDHVALQLPEKLETLLGENGVRLSGGQRQRVALARAFYYERDIILMDEATSSLDDETEAEVIDTIKRLKGSKTLIVIAHRLTTVEHCDILYRLEAGRVAAIGTYHEVVTCHTSRNRKKNEV